MEASAVAVAHKPKTPVDVSGSNDGEVAAVARENRASWRTPNWRPMRYAVSAITNAVVTSKTALVLEEPGARVVIGVGAVSGGEQHTRIDDRRVVTVEARQPAICIASVSEE